MRVPQSVPLLMALAAATPAFAQAPEPAPPHESLRIASAVMGETRRINVYVPPQYDTCPSAHFPVLYMPDGGIAEDFPHLASTVNELIASGEMRPVIVVGVENTVRRRDVTPPTQTEADRAVTDQPGGAARFRTFFRDELIPVISARYRATAESAVIGESLAGLFVLDTLFAQPDTFDTYIALDPSLWWNGGAMARDLPRQLPSLSHDSKRLLIASAGAETSAAEVVSFVGALRTAAPPSLHWNYIPRPDLRHDNIYRSLKVPVLKNVFDTVPDSLGDCR